MEDSSRRASMYQSEMVGFGMHASTSGMPSSDPGPSTSMPPSEEILSAFEEVLKKMELPPDKVRTLRNCDLKKKWDLVCNQRMFKTQAVADPSVYLEKLSACLDTKAHKKKKKLPGGESEVLSHLEISLRTNSIDWVHSFLSPEHDGFRILVDYLSLLQGSYSEFYMPDNSNGNATASPLHASQPTFLYPNSFDGQHYSSASSTISSYNGGGISFDDGYSSMKNPMNTSIFRTKPASNASKVSKQLKQINELEDDVHLCISCLRALMNNKAGWNIVFDSPQAIYCIVRSILHHSLRTKALAIDLLSAICMVKDGHERIVNAFDRFRMEYKERYRFQTLFHFFHSPPEFNVDFLASCMKYINVVVHSTEDLNQRVALQYEFTNLGLDRFLEQQHGFQDYDAISIHVNRYRSNSIDVDRLLSESNHRLELLDYTTKLERDNSLQRERLQEVEADYIARQAMLSKRLSDLMTEKDTLEREKNNKDLTIHTLTRDFKDREQKYERERSQLESRIQELEKTKKEIQEGLKIAQKASAKAAASAVALQNSPMPSPSTPTAPGVNAKPAMSTTSVPPAPPPPPSNLTTKSSAAPPPPPPPPPPQLSKMAPVHKAGGIPPPPPNLNMLRNAIIEAPTKIKKIAPTKHKLPMFNWSALNPNQVKGTVFNEINDENLADALNLTFLEEMFRVGNADSTNELTSSIANDQPSPGSSASSTTTSTTGVHKESSNKTTLLGTKRLQNIAITRRKLAKPVGEIMAAVHRFDLSSLPQDHVDILLPIVPTPDEVQQYQDYAAKNDGTFDGLTLEDQFLASLMNIERLSQKLNIMAFMAGFTETVNLLVPQIQKVTAASKSIKEATSFHKVIEVILAVGNAMNGTRRVPVDGFKLSSLDSLMILKSSRDRSITLMHVIAEIIYNDFSNLLDTLSEQLKFAESAAGVSMESIGADVRDIEAKFKNAVTEENRKGEDAPATLKQFLEDAKPQIALLRDNYKLAQEAFVECAEFYGEMSAARSQPDSSAFFTRISTFVKHFEQALSDNETRRAMEQRLLAEQERKAAQIERNATNLDKNKTQSRMVDELNARFLRSMGADPKRKLDSRDIGDGDFERIMNGLKDGYVALDAPAPVPVKRRGIGKSPSPNRRPKSITKEVQRDRA